MTTTPPEGLEVSAGGCPGDVEGELRENDQQLIDQLLAEVRQLREAVETRDVIGQAKGIVMVGFRCDADTAFDILCRLSQNTNRKVRDVAVLVVSTVVDDRPLPEDLQATLLSQLRARPQ